MARLLSAALAALALAPAGAATTKVPEYRLVKTLPLGPPDRWDFVRVDAVQHRVYVAHSSEITVVDSRTGALVGRIANIKGAHDVAIVPAVGRGYADNGDTGVVTVFDLHSLRRLASITVDHDADAMMYDPTTRRLVVGSGDARSASIVDIGSNKRVASVPLGGSAESMALDGRGNVFINVDTLNTIVRLSLGRSLIDARWPTPGCEAPHGLAYDSTTQRLFASCKNGRMIVLDAMSGKVLALLPIGKGTDGAAFDPVRKLAFSSNRDGTLSIVAERGSKSFVSLGYIATAPGARTMALDPRTGRIFLVTATVAAQRPAKNPGEAPDYAFAPGTVKLMILEPRR